MENPKTLRSRVEELERADERRRALSRLISRLATCTDVESLWVALSDESSLLLGWDGLCLALRAPGDDDLEVLASSVVIDGQRRPFPRERRHLSGQPPAMLGVMMGQSVLLEESLAVQSGLPTSFEKICLPMANHMWVPLRRGEGVLGFLSAHLRAPARWGELDLQQLELLADTITPALVQVLADRQAHFGDTPHPVTIAGSMATPEGQSLGNLIQWLYREIRRYLGFNRASLFLYDEETQALVSDDLLGLSRRDDLLQSKPQPIGYSISGKCFTEGRPIVIHDCSKTDLIPREYVEELSLKSSVAVPVSVGGRVIGVLRIDDTEQTHRFTDEDVEFFSMLGMMVGILALSPQLFREVREAERAMRERERSFRSLAENSSDGILIVSHGHRVFYTNGRAAEITGRDWGHLTRRRLSDWAPPTILEEIARVASAQRGEDEARALQREMLLARPDGSEIPVEVSVTGLEWRGEPAVMVILRDVTERRELEREILEISEGEQRRFGFDLHDGLGQTIAAIAIRCRALEQQLSGSSPAGSAAAAQIAALAKHASSEAHFLARGLSPVHLDSRGLVLALDDLAADLAAAYGIECRVEATEGLSVMEGAVSTQLYRIAQEALNNAVRHGRPHSVRIRLTRGEGEITLAIEDDGEGFPLTQGAASGLGLKIMEHRASTIGAHLAIGRSSAGGIAVVCTMRDRGESR